MENIPMIAAAIGSAAAICLAYLWLRARAIDLHAASEMIDTHYAATQKLIGDETVPESVVEFSVWFAGQVGRPKLARRLIRDIAFGGASKRRAVASALETDLKKLTPVQRDLFSSMVVNGMVSCAASDPLLSRAYLYSLTIFFSLSGTPTDTSISQERANTAALDISSRHLCAA